MTDEYTRRGVIATVVNISTLIISGCYQPGGPTQRTLHGRDIQSPRVTDSGLIIEMSVSASARNIDDSEALFRNVSVVAYTESKQVVGQESVGTVEIGTGVPVSLSCSERPDYMTFTIASDSCEHTTFIGVHEVRSSDADLMYPVVHDKNCGDPDLVVPD